MQSEALSKNFVRSLGHIYLCGVLHVSWQTKDGVNGQYFITLLYRDFILLASASKVDQRYTVQACIGLNELRVEETDNGRGMHTASESSAMFISETLKSHRYFIHSGSNVSGGIFLEANGILGLQCHTAPFSWKLVFEYDHQLFEITMTACSPKEELEWRSRLTNCSGRDGLHIGEQAVCASLSLDIKPMGTVFGKPGECNSLSISRPAFLRAF
jgi:hypothetical protein